MAVNEININEVTFNQCEPNEKWKLIYDNTNVINLTNVKGFINTKLNIYEGVTQDECFDKIDELTLVYYYPLNENEILLFSGGTRTIIPIEEE